MTDAPTPERQLFKNAFDFLGKCDNVFEQHRPELHRYCLSLTSNVWDAEDLSQEAMVRVYGAMGYQHNGIGNPRAYLFRVATNVWIDWNRRREPDVMDNLPETAAQSATPQSPVADDVREALGRLATKLPPRERAAVLLADVFGYSMDEAAGMLGVSTGAVKTALHRARARLAESAKSKGAASGDALPARYAVPVDEALVDAFVNAFNARDVDALVALMLPGVQAQVIGATEGYDGKAARAIFTHTFGGQPAADIGGPRAEKTMYGGEPIVVLWHSPKDGKLHAGDIVRLETSGGKCSLLRHYCFCPDTLKLVFESLGLPHETRGYHF